MRATKEAAKWGEGGDISATLNGTDIDVLLIKINL